MSEFALHKILGVVRKYNVKHILEVGVGIGTISGTLIKMAGKEGLNIQFTGTESNNFCLEQIPNNLGGLTSKLRIFPNVAALPETLKFDLIIIDGSEKALEEIKSKLMPHGVILVEGDRSDQVEAVKSIFPRSKYAQFISLKRNRDYSVKKSEDFRGGLKIIFTDPTFDQISHWFHIKLRSAAKFRIRKLLK